MATIAGFGSAHLGRADIRPDGTFVTTEWLVLGHLPLIPIRSFRLATIDGSVAFGFPSSSSSCEIVCELPIQWRQVFRTYGFFAFVAAWTATWVFVPFDILMWDRGRKLFLSIPLALILIGAVSLVPFATRRRAFRRKFGPSQSLQPTPGARNLSEKSPVIERQPRRG
jgi:hypothetical protein